MLLPVNIVFLNKERKAKSFFLHKIPLLHVEDQQEVQKSISSFRLSEAGSVFPSPENQIFKGNDHVW
jgi:hypothetical protein